jgi:predicted neuraminidase
MIIRYFLLFIYCTVFCISVEGQNNKENAIITQQLIFPLQEKHVHGSTIVQLPNGDLLAAWFYGSGERKEDDVKIMGSRMSSGTGKWSAPFEMADTYGIPDCNPVLFLNAGGRLFLVWIAVQANLWEQSVIRFRTSVDYSGKGAPVWNWQDDILLKPDEKFVSEVEQKLKQLPSQKHGWAGYAPQYDEMIINACKDLPKRSFGWMTRIRPIILNSGRILLPLYSDGLNMSLVAISDDDGSTWKPSLPIVGRGPIQPSLAQRKNGDIIAYMRDSGDEPTRVQVSSSSDNGESWTAATKTDIPNTASVHLLRLNNGNWAFLGNDIDDGRYRLTLFLSTDEGKTWSKKIRLENKMKNEGNFSYPAMIQDAHGKLHITYSYHETPSRKSIKYVFLDPVVIK